MLGNLFRIFICFAFAVVCPVFSEEPADRNLKSLPDDLAALQFYTFLSISFSESESQSDYSKGIQFAQAERWEAAEKKFTQALSLEPNFDDAYNARGAVRIYLNNYEEALKDFDTAIKLYPNYILAFNNRGIVWTILGDYDKARKDYEETLALGFRYSEIIRKHIENSQQVAEEKNLGARNFTILPFFLPITYIGHSQALKRYNKGMDALFEAKKAEQLENEESSAVERKAYQDQMWELAEKNFTQALSLDPNFDDAYSVRGFVRIYLNDYEEALKDFNTALQLDPQSFDALFYRGKAHLELKQDYYAALEDFKQALALNPNHEGALNNMETAKQMISQKPPDIKNLEEPAELPALSESKIPFSKRCLNIFRRFRIKNKSSVLPP